MRTFFRYFGAVMLIVSLCCGCWSGTETTTITACGRYSNVLAIYYHEQNHYSIAVKTIGSTIQMIDLNRVYDDTLYTCNYTIIDDVKPNEIMYVDYTATLNDYLTSYVSYTIHIRNIDDVSTSGWDHGKFGSGQTQRIDK
jgi:hypothetical protein